MKRVFLLLLLYSTILFAANDSKNVQLSLTKTPIVLDGIIDEAWRNADSADSFVQLSPFYKKTPSVRTTAKILTDEENLYCLIIAYQNRNEIDIRSGIHDQRLGDYVSLMIDTYNNRQSAYKFAVTASGVRYDSRLIDDARNRDDSWDGIWFAQSRVYDWGYVVEMQIPFKSIKYDKNISEWGLDFDRWVANTNEDLYWCEYEQSEGQRIAKFGKLYLNSFKPQSTGLNLEIYPVGIGKFSLEGDNKYKTEGNAGLDIFYNPSPQLTYQLTINPDYAQIEADPYDVNISRYETYFNEKRPFFTEGNEIFNPSGSERGSGFYKPLEFFYSRRIGKKLADGSEVPLIFGTKAFGRINNLDYGGILAMTGEKDYDAGNSTKTEKQAFYGVARLRKQILDNSFVGVLFVGKKSESNNYGVLDVDGALRGSNWQLAYQVARSFDNSNGDFAASAGFRKFTDSWYIMARGRYIGSDFEISQIGYVPWKGTAQTMVITGPAWYYKEGLLKSMMLYLGGSLDYAKEDGYTDHNGFLGINMQFKANWGYELSSSFGKSKDSDVIYDSFNLHLSSWYNISPKWNANFGFDYDKTYNFSRKYLGTFFNVNAYIEYRPTSSLEFGSSASMWIEKDPDGNTEEIYYNTRPYISVTPVNNLNMRLYVDNVITKTTGEINNIVMGFLFSYNFSPKSWIYFALNDLYERRNEFDRNNKMIPGDLYLKDRAGVLKLKYLYYF